MRTRVHVPSLLAWLTLSLGATSERAWSLARTLQVGQEGVFLVQQVPRPSSTLQANDSSTRLVLDLRPSCPSRDTVLGVAEGQLIPHGDRFCTDTLVLRGHVKLDRVLGEDKTRITVFVGFQFDVSRLSIDAGDATPDWRRMAQQSVRLPPAQTTLVTDTVATVATQLDLPLPTLRASLWHLHPLVRLGQNLWMPMRACAVATLLRSSEGAGGKSLSSLPIRRDATVCIVIAHQGD